MRYLYIIIPILVVSLFFIIFGVIFGKKIKNNPLMQIVRDPRFAEGMGGKGNLKRVIKAIGTGANLRGYVFAVADVSLLRLDLLKDVGFVYAAIEGNKVTLSLKEEGGTNLIALVASEQTQTLSLDSNENVSAPNENVSAPNENVSAQPVNNQPFDNQQPVNNQPVSGAKPLQDEKELDPYEQWMALQNQDKQ